MEAAGHTICDVLMCGGLCASKTYIQTHADVLDPITPLMFTWRQSGHLLATLRPLHPPSPLVSPGDSPSLVQIHYTPMFTWFRSQANNWRPPPSPLSLCLPGREILLPINQPSVLVGAAMLGAAASGHHATLGAAARAMGGPVQGWRPRADLKGFHDKKFAVFLQMQQDQIKYRDIMNALTQLPCRPCKPVDSLDPVELWDTFKRETLQAAKECIGERSRSRRGFVSLENMEESRAAGLAGNRDQHRALSRRTRTLLGRD
ncbi:FGGY carbohydrate kinase domain-containing protein [Chionoecetes opilio]|uniref:FGGY carbohydrate kinase domain-containing protein n=1 Tax=Chionoecetes opilio TaxID=41210 RepID=A0A8J8WF83_CHIOP|nr:FGGY carbohydrate kinase domain-containing protein [Chionoecetes opilio]